MNGFIKLHRKMIEWGWYSDCVVKDVFLHILMTANYTDGSYRGYEIKAGDAIIGRKRMSQDLGFSEQQIRTAIKKLESTGEITLKSTNKFTIATVENWAFYQCDEELATSEQPTNNQQLTNNQPTSNQQVTTSKKYNKVINKEIKNNKEKEIYKEKESYGELGNVKLTVKEYEKLVEDFSYETTQEAIEFLGSYKIEKNYKTKSDNLTIRRWVIDAVTKDKRNNKNDFIKQMMEEELGKDRMA